MRKKGGIAGSNSKKRLGLFKKKAGNNGAASFKEPKFLHDIDVGKHPREVENEMRLWLSDGRVVKDLKELAEALADMKESAFKQHVSKDKNEFADWVRKILKQEEIAKAMDKLKKRRQMIKVINKYASVQIPSAAQKLLKEKELPNPADLEERLLPKQEIKAPRSINEYEQEEMRLMEEEAQINREEEALNAKRLELSKKRYKLIKKRGELEGRRFKSFFEKYNNGKTSEIITPGSYSESTVQVAQTQEEITPLFEKAKRYLKDGDLDNARKSFKEIRTALNKGIFSNEERKVLEYELLGLEADIRIAALR